MLGRAERPWSLRERAMVAKVGECGGGVSRRRRGKAFGAGATARALAGFEKCSGREVSVRLPFSAF